jgi:iron complex transport system substrate-binding protein
VQDQQQRSRVSQVIRIAALSPAAAEIVCALGLRDALVGRGAACDYPPDITRVPVITTARAADADLIVTHALHDAVAVDALDEGMLMLDPTSLDDVFASIQRVGDAADVSARATELARELRARRDALSGRLGELTHRPTVAALDGVLSPSAAGRWTPELIALAGGVAVMGGAGMASAPCEWDDVIHSQPEMVVLMPGNTGIDDAVRQFEQLAGHEVWRDVPATYLNQLYAVDAASYFSRPGPRLIDGAEILAGLLHPNRVARPTHAQARRVSPLVTTNLRMP